MNDNDAPAANWLSASEALARLGIARQTLYAYVSRGMIRMRPDPADPRRSLYDPHAIETLRDRKARGRARTTLARSTIDFGEPVLASRISQILHGGLWYRGRNAVRLSREATLEETAALLWETLPLPQVTIPALAHQGPAPLARALAALAAMADPGAQPAMFARGPAALTEDGALCLRIVARALAGETTDGPVHRVLSQAWRLDADGADMVRRALVLCADHELNASAFAVRVVASTGAPLAGCLLAGLTALSGPRHGGMTDRVRAMLSEPAMLTNPRAAVAARLARGEDLPGFGHRLYPDGDPRAQELLDLVGPSPAWRGLCAAIHDLSGQRPNIDAALVALEQHLTLPPGAAFVIFAAGRTAGWIAHALEQHQDGQLIRPRAAYTGPEPDERD